MLVDLHLVSMLIWGTGRNHFTSNTFTRFLKYMLWLVRLCKIIRKLITKDPFPCYILRITNNMLTRCGVKISNDNLMAYHTHLPLCLCLVHTRTSVNKNMNLNFLEFPNISTTKPLFTRWSSICNVDWVIGHIISLVKTDNLMHILPVV